MDTVPSFNESWLKNREHDVDPELDLTFSTEEDTKGKTSIIDLIPDGRNIKVTNENKAEYVEYDILIIFDLIQ